MVVRFLRKTRYRCKVDGVAKVPPLYRPGIQDGLIGGGGRTAAATAAAYTVVMPFR